jgi:hypothetical protein
MPDQGGQGNFSEWQLQNNTADRAAQCRHVFIENGLFPERERAAFHDSCPASIVSFILSGVFRTKHTTGCVNVTVDD